MKKFILSLIVLMSTFITVNAQTKTTYAAITNHQYGWTVAMNLEVMSSTSTAPNNHDFMPTPTKRYYILPPTGKLFDSPLFALNYISQFGFELVEVYVEANKPTYIVKSIKMATIPMTTNWNDRINKTINK